MKAFLVLALVAFVSAGPLTRPAPAPETPMVQIVINLKEGETSHVVDVPVVLPTPEMPVMPMPLPVFPIVPLPAPELPIMPLPAPVYPVQPMPWPVPEPELLPSEDLHQPELMPSEDLYEPGFLRPGVPLIY